MDNYQDYKDKLPDWVKGEQDFEDYKVRHSAEHIYAQAITELFDGIKLAVAHISEDTFANDASWGGHKLSEEELAKIEQKMQEIIAADLPIVRKEISVEEAQEIFKENPFKLEWLSSIADRGEKVSVYYTGEQYVDLCRGPHISSTGEIKALKLLNIAGAYWRGDENNEMLTRVYGAAFDSQEKLEQFLERREKARENDHRKLGKELGLFVFSDLVGQGLPLWTEKGSAVRREMERFIVDEEIKRGYQHVYTPDVAKLELYETSGHYPYYKDSMYAPIEIDDEKFMLRPMTCPHHFELYKSSKHSYRELPMRIAELAKLYRYEKSGELSGLIRVRSFCLADAHIVTPKELAEQEINGVLDLIEYVSEILGFEANEDFWYRLSLGNRENDKKYFKDDAAWDHAEDVLREVLESRGNVKFVEAEDEAAFYGPKIDVQMRNVNGKEDTAFTVQYDFVMPKRFELSFINAEGKEEEPVVIHRSSVGAIERIIAFLIERNGGNFPAWLAPEQVRVIPISDDNLEYASKLEQSLKEAGIRVQVDSDNDRMQNKIRKAQEMKVPYMLIVGGREQEEETVSVRMRSGEEIKGMKFIEFQEKLLQNIRSRNLELSLQ